MLIQPTPYTNEEKQKMHEKYYDLQLAAAVKALSDAKRTRELGTAETAKGAPVERTPGHKNTGGMY